MKIRYCPTCGTKLVLGHTVNSGQIYSKICPKCDTEYRYDKILNIIGEY